MKKYLSLLLATLMVLTALLGLVACSDPNEPKDPTTDEDNKPPVVTPPTDDGEEERIPLTFPQASYNFNNAN